jgi:hypothetical protein
VQKNYGKFVGIAISGLIVFGIILLLGPLFDSGSKSLVQPQPVPATAQTTSTPPAANVTHPVPPAPRWIHANYRGLVDLQDLTQSGQTIQSVIAEGVKHRYEKGQLQPLLDQFSRLLPQALETARGGPAELPRTSIIDELPENSPLPAWAAILKGGRIMVTDDGNGTASVFATGTDAKQAYDACYSVVRHALAALLPSDGQSLKVRTYAYQNDYANCELKLCLDPYVTEAKDFPVPAGTRTTLTTYSNALLTLGQHVDKLEKSVQQLQSESFMRSLEEGGKTRVHLDPTQKSYQRVECNNGPLMVSVDSMESYLDGYRLTLQIGNPSYMTYSGFEATTYWGPSWQDIAGTNNFSEAISAKWQSLQRSNTVTLTDSLMPGKWNWVKIIVAPAKPDEIRNLEMSFKSSTVSFMTMPKPDN